MRTPLTSIASAAVALLLGAAPAHAVVCTGTTQTVANGGNVTAEFLLGTGNCVAAGDKVFGEFGSSGAFTGTGSASFSFFATPGNVTIGFLGTVAPNLVGTLNYTVGVDDDLAQGFLINGLQKDFTLNASITGDPATATLTGGVTSPSIVAFDCTRTVNPSSSNCPETHLFAPVSEIDVSQTLTTGPNAVVTALTDTISQVAPVSEPGSLALLGTGLLGLIAGHRWMRRRKNDDTGCRAAA